MDFLLVTPELNQRHDLCFKGGGGGGGSGIVDYPAHMKQFHYQALSDNGADTVNNSIVDLLNVALTANPYASFAVYSGATEKAAIVTAASTLKTVLGDVSKDDLANAITTFATKFNTEVFDSATIDAEVAAFTTILDNQLDSEVYPKFEAGMRDINAVMSSAFVIGKALIVEGRNAQVAKYDADLRHKAYLFKADSTLKMAEAYINWKAQIVELNRTAGLAITDMNKVNVVIEREGTDQDLKLAELEATWEFEAFMYAGNFLASIGGGTYVPTATKGISTTQSALSGALSGAAMGATMGPIGAAVGAVVGGIGGLLMS